MIQIKNKNYKTYDLYRMEKKDFNLVKEFLERQRQKLNRIEFFYPYKDEELLEVLDNGYFLGLFDKDKLIATFGIDFDEEYAKQIADIINGCKNIGIDKAYESSGLMVDGDYRGQGIANFLMDEICHEADKKHLNICGVVQMQNTASMTTFFSHGFELRGVWSMGGKYDFGYLLKKKNSGYNENIQKNLNLILQCPSKYGIIVDVEGKVDNTDMPKHRSMLARNYYGILCDKKSIFYIRKGEKIMNKKQLIDAIAEKAQCTAAEAGKCCDAMLEAIMDAMKAGDKVALLGFGTFEVKTRAARTGVNPATGEKIDIPESKVISFKASKSNKDSL